MLAHIAVSHSPITLAYLYAGLSWEKTGGECDVDSHDMEGLTGPGLH